MIKILFLIDTHREAIALAPVIRAMWDGPTEFETSVCLSGPHSAELDSVLEMYEIGVSRELEIPVPARDATPAQLLARRIDVFDPMLAAEAPDWIIVQGGSTTAMAGCLVGFYRRIRVAHVGAGLRTHDKYDPFPEEAQRRLVDVLADMHFAPTDHAERHLLDEGVVSNRITVTGSTGIDTLQHALGLDCDLVRGILAEVSPEARLILVRAYDRVTQAEPFDDLCAALARVATEHGPEIHIVVVVHADCTRRESMDAELGELENVTLVSPLPYVEFAHLLNRSYLVLTDSGGVQEEAASLGKPVLVLDTVTDRLEGLGEGITKVVGTEAADIVKEISLLLNERSAYEAMAHPTEIFGDGRAGERIVYEFRRLRQR